jgi:hypothetical protein
LEIFQNKSPNFEEEIYEIAKIFGGFGRFLDFFF